MKENIMKCCGCEKEILLVNELDKNGNAQWFGSYDMNKGGFVCKKVICASCIQDSKKKEDYKT